MTLKAMGVNNKAGPQIRLDTDLERLATKDDDPEPFMHGPRCISWLGSSDVGQSHSDRAQVLHLVHVVSTNGIRDRKEEKP